MSSASQNPLVIILMGSASDHETMLPALETLREFGVECEYRVASAHRTPDVVADLARNARERGVKVFIAGAGGAAHLAGVIAAHTTLPVIGVPIDSSSLAGLDALLATVQMPAGIPVATVAVGKAGAKNAGLLAVQILACHDQQLAQKLKAFKENLAKKVLEAKLPI